jgi:hypothetical protein
LDEHHVAEDDVKDYNMEDVGKDANEVDDEDDVDDNVDDDEDVDVDVDVDIDEDEDEDEDENEDEDEDEDVLDVDEDEDRYVDEDDSKDALYEEEADVETTELDESMDNEEEARDADYHVAKAEPKQKGGRNYKKLSASDMNFADRVALLLKYDMEFGSSNPVRSYVTPNNVQLGDWLHEQCKKYKDGRLYEYHVKTLNGIGVQFEKQRNVVGNRYTAANTIFAIHKYEKERGHIKRPWWTR